MTSTVLIVEKEPLAKRSLSARLARQGCRVLEAEGVEGARTRLSEEEADVVLLDLSSLREEALLLIPWALRVRPGVQIILLTGPEQIPLSIRGMKLGAFDDVMVPFDVDHLLERIAEALAKGRAANPET